MRKRHYSESPLKSAIYRGTSRRNPESSCTTARPEGVKSEIPAIPSREMTATAAMQMDDRDRASRCRTMRASARMYTRVHSVYPVSGVVCEREKRGGRETIIIN